VQDRSGATIPTTTIGTAAAIGASTSVRGGGNRDDAAGNVSLVEKEKHPARKRPEVTEGARCAATNSRGERCASYRAVGSDYCWNHDPELVRERRVALAENRVARESNRIRDEDAESRRLPVDGPPWFGRSRRRARGSST
jgi:hypothetical protein